jgi:5-hydroxyisourate hydrolase
MDEPMSGISTHVLDTSIGRPAAGVPVSVEFLEGKAWKQAGRAQTDANGRVAQLLPASQPLRAGFYRVNFDTAAYFDKRNTEWFHPHVSIVFGVADAGQHYHVPLLLSPYGYTTYRGS